MRNFSRNGDEESAATSWRQEGYNDRVGLKTPSRSIITFRGIEKAREGKKGEMRRERIGDVRRIQPAKSEQNEHR